MFIRTFLLRITHTIISQSIADSSWITTYILYVSIKPWKERKFIIRRVYKMFSRKIWFNNKGGILCFTRVSGRNISKHTWVHDRSIARGLPTTSVFIACSVHLLIVGLEGSWCTWSHLMIHALGRTPLNERSARRRDLCLTTPNTYKRYPCSQRDSNPRSQQASGRRPTP